MLEGWHCKGKGEVDRGGRGAGASLTYEEVAFHSRRIGGATDLAQRGVPEAVIYINGRWSSDSFTVCVNANLEELVCVSYVLEHGAREFA